MKNFFNREEQTDHLGLLACQGKAKELAESSALTQEEQKCLKKVEEWCEKFNKLIFARFGLPYKRKLLCTLDSNELLLVGKYAPQQQTIAMGAQEDIAPMYKEIQGVYCMTCKKTNHLECAMYAMGVALGMNPVILDENKCPFSVEDKFDEEV